MNTLRSMSKDQRVRTPFQGEFLVAKTQAWKAWLWSLTASRYGSFAADMDLCLEIRTETLG
jgi:hypothetical protein